MKFFHLADLHLGKRIYEASMLDEQRAALSDIIAAVDSEKPDGVLIAGDVYDKSVPSLEAMELLDGFLTALAERSCPVYIVSGNHDSAGRLSHLAALLKASNIHFSGSYEGALQPIVLRDAIGEVKLWLMPFVRPFDVRRVHGDGAGASYSEAFAFAISEAKVDPAERNILVAHQFFAGGTVSDSEDLSVGGSEAVDPACLAPFDYVALGHLHRPQKVGRETVRYAGSPLAYSFSEAEDEKSITLLELGKKGEVSVSALPIKPIRPLKNLKGKYDELMHLGHILSPELRESYLHITLTDESDIPDAVFRLRTVYPHLLHLDYDNARTRLATAPELTPSAESLPPDELFAELFRKQNGREMTEKEALVVSEMIKAVWEGRA